MPHAFLKNIACLAAILALAGAPLSAYASEGGGHGGEAKGEAKGEGKGEAKGEGKEEGGKKKEGPEEVSGGRFEGDPVYVHMQPLTLPVINNRGAEQLVTLVVDLQTKDFDTATLMHEAMPRLKDAILRGLYEGFANGKLKNGPMIDLEKVKKNIKLTSNGAFGEGSVLDVLIQAIQQRKF